MALSFTASRGETTMIHRDIISNEPIFKHDGGLQPLTAPTFLSGSEAGGHISAPRSRYWRSWRYWNINPASASKSGELDNKLHVSHSLTSHLCRTVFDCVCVCV